MIGRFVLPQNVFELLKADDFPSTEALCKAHAAMGAALKEPFQVPPAQATLTIYQARSIAILRRASARPSSGHGTGFQCSISSMSRARPRRAAGPAVPSLTQNMDDPTPVRGRPDSEPSS